MLLLPVALKNRELYQFAVLFCPVVLAARAPVPRHVLAVPVHPGIHPEDHPAEGVCQEASQAESLVNTFHHH